MAVVVALASEVSSLRERLDAHERIAGKGLLPSSELVESYRPDQEVESDRETWRDRYIRRLFRVMTEESEAN